MRKLLILTVLSIVLLSPQAHAQTVIDSLKAELEQTTNTRLKIDILNKMALKLKGSDPKKSEYRAKQALKLARENNYGSGVADALYYLGQTYFSQNNGIKALDFYLKSLEVNEKLKDWERVVEIENSIGDLYFNLGDKNEAKQYYEGALKMAEKNNSKTGLALSCNNMGKFYHDAGKYQKALDFYNKSLEINKAIGDKRKIAQSHNNIGEVYLSYKQYGTALISYFNSLIIVEAIGDKRGIAASNHNIGKIHYYQKDYDKALNFYLKSIEIIEETGDKFRLASAYSDIGSYFNTIGDYQKAIEYYTKALEVAKTVNLLKIEKEIAEGLSLAYAKLEQYQQAYDYHILFKQLSDTLLNRESTREITKLEMQNEFKKEQEKKSLQHKAELDRQMYLRNFLIGGFAFVLILSFVLFRSYRMKRRDNKLLASQKGEIQKQARLLETINKELEDKNIQIIDSINYARHIQQAILIPENEIRKHIPKSFIFYAPKDIVSGDFYWFAKMEDKLIFAAIDCTGHGVPGAFMSMIGNTLLNEIVNDKKITKPDEILEELHQGILKALQKNKQDGDSEDGMDMSLCTIDKRNKHVQFAGAKNHAYVIQKGKLKVVRADYFSIGGKPMREGIQAKFTCHDIHILDDTLIYMFSDGYMDQFGGEKNTKFNSPRFKEMLLKIKDMDMQKQKQVIADSFKNWKGDNKQIDDILVVGMRLS